MLGVLLPISTAYGAGATEQQPPAKPAHVAGVELVRIPPTESGDAAATFHVAEGYRLDLVAAEPLVVDPVAMCFDEFGRLYVVEMIDYSEQEHERLGRVRLLSDEDGDGVFDHSTVFAEGLSWPTAVICYAGGVYVGAAPDVLYLRDADGDGAAEERTVVFTGLGRGNVQGLVNSFQWGLDSRIHVAVSSAGAVLRRPQDPESAGLALSGRDFAFEPRTHEAAPITGGGQHGASFNRWGDRFVCSNSDHLQAIVFEDRYLERNPYQAVAGAKRSIAADGPQAEVYRTSPVEPWRIARTKLRVAGLAPGPIEGGGRASGYFTSATGVTIDEGGLHGETLALVADVGSNLIHRKRLAPDGVTYRGERLDERLELVTSTDNWFRPVQMASGPDGAVYVADMYREVIEHPASLPPEIKQTVDLTSGRDRGRIYRLAPASLPPTKAAPLGDAATEELVRSLENPNMWVRTCAARLLYERRDPTTAELARELLRSSPSAEARMHALYVLAGARALADGELEAALADAHPQVRRHVLRLAESRLQASSALLDAACKLADDSDLKVCFQLALSLGACDDSSASKVLAHLLRTAENSDLISAALVASHSCAGDVFRLLIANEDGRLSTRGHEALAALARQIQRQGRADDIATLVEILKSGDAPSLDSPAAATLAALGPLDQGPGSSRSVAGNPLEEARASTYRRHVTLARHVLDREEPDVHAKIAAIRFLSLGDLTAEADRLAELLSPAQPAELQAATLQALAQQGAPAVANVVLAAWSQFTPELREQAFALLASREAWVDQLLGALEGGAIAAADIPASGALALANYPSESVRARAAKLRGASVAADRQQVFDDYREALDLAGDSHRGAALFDQHCTNCHQVAGRGHAIGPSLAAMANRGADALLYNILIPNGEIDGRYAAYTAVTVDGRVLSGIIAGESASSVSLIGPQGETSTILRIDIDELKSSGASLMPEGFEQHLDKQAMADLLAYLMSAATAAGQETP